MLSLMATGSAIHRGRIRVRPAGARAQGREAGAGFMLSFPASLQHERRPECYPSTRMSAKTLPCRSHSRSAVASPAVSSPRTPKTK